MERLRARVVARRALHSCRKEVMYMQIATITITPIELAAVRAVVETDLKHFGAALRVQRPELVEALESAKIKLAKLAAYETAKISV
jgi:predicted DNA-binding protein (UPF0251 family)